MPIYKTSDPSFCDELTSVGMEWAHTGGAELGWKVAAVAMRDDPQDDAAPVVMIAELPPNTSVPRHAHDAHRVEILLKGAIVANGVLLEPGDVQVSGPGEFYGPNTVGPEGATSIEIISSVSGTFRILPEEGASEEDRAFLDDMWTRIQAQRDASTTTTSE